MSRTGAGIWITSRLWPNKFIQDALVSCRILENDGWRHIRGFTDVFYVDRHNPRIEVAWWRKETEMAERRMFSKVIIDSDAFLDMPLSTQALYFHLSMEGG